MFFKIHFINQLVTRSIFTSLAALSCTSLPTGNFMKLSIQGNPIQSIYNMYTDGKFIVNRRYQRKLVWNINEKARFIDSILNEYPIPMILVANHKKNDEGSPYEILDGMQRLNAIIAFIEGEFCVNQEYFNLDVISLTKSKREAGELEQNSPMLSQEKCNLFLNYQILCLHQQNM